MGDILGIIVVGRNKIDIEKSDNQLFKYKFYSKYITRALYISASH